MPALDDRGVDRREVDLAEPLEVRIVGPQHVHDLAALVGDLLERHDAHAVDHDAAPRYSRYQATVSRNPSRNSTRGDQPMIRFTLLVSSRCSRISPLAVFRIRGSGRAAPMSSRTAPT